MLGLAPPTAYDLRFRLLGIPVRVNPLFWLVMAILSGGDNQLPRILTFVGCAFVSILVHEYGHGLMSRHFGHEPTEVVLYGMGGYCLCDLERQTPWQRAAVLFAGPGAGFLLIGLIALLGLVFFRIPFSDDLNMMTSMLGLGGGNLSGAIRRLPPTGLEILWIMIWINLLWGIVNLFPIWPLDGGRLAEVFLTMYNRRNGRRWAHIVSLVTAGGIAALCLKGGQMFTGIWFIYFAFINYQVLQSFQSARSSFPEDDADWWKR
jgi:stage IV sporulation protein FB